jgi:hypothetical protein
MEVAGAFGDEGGVGRHQGHTAKGVLVMKMKIASDRISVQQNGALPPVKLRENRAVGANGGTETTECRKAP